MAEDISTSNNGTAGTEQQQTEQSFTQADVDRIVTQRLARATKDMPNSEELAAFRSWKATQQTEADKLNDMTKERDTAKADLTKANAKIEQYERERFLTSKGVSTDDLDYYCFKIAQKVNETTTFEAAAEEFLKNKNAGKARVDMGGSLGGGSKKTQSTNDMMNALIRGKFN